MWVSLTVGNEGAKLLKIANNIKDELVQLWYVAAVDNLMQVYLDLSLCTQFLFYTQLQTSMVFVYSKSKTTRG